MQCYCSRRQHNSRSGCVPTSRVWRHYCNTVMLILALLVEVSCVRHCAHAAFNCESMNECSSSMLLARGVIEKCFGYRWSTVRVARVSRVAWNLLTIVITRARLSSARCTLSTRRDLNLGNGNGFRWLVRRTVRPVVHYKIMLGSCNFTYNCHLILCDDVQTTHHCDIQLPYMTLPAHHTSAPLLIGLLSQRFTRLSATWMTLIKTS